LGILTKKKTLLRTTPLASSKKLPSRGEKRSRTNGGGSPCIGGLTLIKYYTVSKKKGKWEDFPKTRGWGAHQDSSQTGDGV